MNREALTQELRGELQAAGRAMIAQNLTWGNAGNLSARLDAHTFLISASGTQLGRLGEDDVVLYPDATSGRKPSKEVPMHRAVYDVRPDVGAVLHGAPFYSTLVACSDADVPQGLFVEAMYYLERTASVPYFHPGSEALGEAVREEAKTANVLFLKNHGVLVFDATVADALMGLQVLEFACRMVVTARAAGVALTSLPERVTKDFLEHAGYKPRRRWPS